MRTSPQVATRPPLAVRSPLAGLLAVLLGSLVLLTVTAGPAGAHAQLVETTPVDGTALDAAPEAVTLRFDEPVNPPPGGVRVFDGEGERVDTDGAVAATDDPRVVGTALEPLDEGAYVVTWRVVSADGHPLRGALVFTVGQGGPADASLVARLLAGDDGVWPALRSAGIVASYLAVLLLAGVLLVSRRLGVPGPDRGVRAAALVGVVAAVLAVPLQAAVVSGDGLAAALDPAQLSAVLVAGVGVAALVRLAALVGVLLLRDGPRLAAAAVALGSFVLDGHTRTVEPAWLLVSADLLHLAAGAVWFGGLVALLVHLRGRRLADDPVGGARLVADWSALATVAVGAVVLGGVALSWATVRSPDALLGTTYGRLLLVKLALAAIVVGLGAWNRQRLVPAVQRAVVAVPAGGATSTTPGGLDAAPATADSEDGWRRLRAVVRGEVVVLVAVLAVTGVLSQQRPAAEAAGLLGTFQTTVALTDDVQLDLVVDPNVAGRNAMHLYALDATGRPLADVEGVTLELVQPAADIGPIVREPLVAGPGHWVLNGDELVVPGRWEVTVLVRLDRFSEADVTIPLLVGGG